MMDIYPFINKEEAGLKITVGMAQRAIVALESEELLGYRAAMQKLLEGVINKMIENNSDANEGMVKGVILSIMATKKALEAAKKNHSKEKA